LEPKQLARPASVPALKDSRVSILMVKESTVTYAFSSLELLFKLLPLFFAPGQMEEWINAMVDMSDQEMTNVATNGGSKTIFVQGEGRVVCQRTLVAPSLGKTDCRRAVVYLEDPDSCHLP
nr:hypothetical protein [Tanacetum cinerariifolium]